MTGTDLEEKLCRYCERKLPLSEFHQRDLKNGVKRLQNRCKGCRKGYHNTHYSQNSQTYKDQAAARRADVKLFIRSLKTDKPCMDCKNTFHFAAMQFDHRPDSGKTVDVSRIAAQGWGKEKIAEELLKCELVCANCHSIRTYERNAGVG